MTIQFNGTGRVAGVLAAACILATTVVMETVPAADAGVDISGTWTRQEGFKPHGKYDEPSLTEAAKEIKANYDEAEDTAIQCIPFGYFRQAMGVYPMTVIQTENLIVFQYELWDAIRAIYMDGRPRPADGTRKTPMGYSRGSFEDGALIIDTSYITANVVDEQIGLDHSDQLIGTERYTLLEDGQVLSLEMTLDDAATFTEPFIVRQEWTRTPGETLYPYGCTDISGQH
jgi:hypothetical protein